MGAATTNYKIYLDSSHKECRPNTVVTSKVQLYLQKNGHTIVNNPEEAQFIIVNTCGFDEAKEKDSVDLFLKLKKKNPVEVLVIGCLNKINMRLVESHPEVKRVAEYTDLDSFFYKEVKFSEVKEAYIDEKIDTADYPSIQIASRILHPFFKKSHLYQKILQQVYRENKIFVEIGTGCVGNCSYCIIKKAKGNPISRNSEDIMNDIEKLYRPGKQLDLVADDCGSYGVDIGTNLPDLLTRIGEKYPDLPIDLQYLHPIWLVKQEEKFIEVFKKVQINSINLTIQSGSNKILNNMNRKIKIQDIMRIMDNFKSVSPSTLYWTHILVGFPGETFGDFMQTIKVMKKFDACGIYTYSDREGTKSVELGNKNSDFVKKIKFQVASLYTKVSAFIKIVNELISSPKSPQSEA